MAFATAYFIGKMMEVRSHDDLVAISPDVNSTNCNGKGYMNRSEIPRSEGQRHWLENYISQNISCFFLGGAYIFKRFGGTLYSESEWWPHS